MSELINEAIEKEKFDQSWRARCTVGHIAKTDNQMLWQHYLGKRPAIVPCALGMWLDEIWLVGTIVFALPPRETSIRYGVSTWELARLWIKDEIPTNAESWFIAKACKHVKIKHADIGCLVSYADPSVGHTGAIYRASNWCEDGRTDDDRKTPRFDYKLNGKIYSRKSHIPPGASFERVPRISKYRFFFRLHQK